MELETKASKYERDNLRKELQKTRVQLSELKYQQRQTVANLSESKAELDAAKIEMQHEHQTRQELERNRNEAENLIKHLKQAKQQEIDTQKQIIQKLQNENEHRELKIKALVGSLEMSEHEISKGNQLRQYLHQTMQQLSELRKQQQHSVSEYENCIKQLEKEKHETIASQTKKIQNLEEEVQLKNSDIKSLENALRNTKLDIQDNDNLKKELQKTTDQLFELRYQQRQTVVTLSETKAELDAAMSEKQHEHQTRQEFERKANESENLIKHLKHCQREVITQKQHLENEIEIRDCKIKGLESSMEKSKQETSERNQLRRDLKQIMEQLYKLRSQQQQTFAKLEEFEAKLDEAKSEKEFEKNKRQILEKKVSEYEKYMKHSKADDNETMLQPQEERILKLEKEVKSKIREVQALGDSQKQTSAILEKTEAELEEMKCKTGFQKKEDTIAKLRDELQQALTKLKETDTHTKTRLSKAIGDELTDNNQITSDLSDKNRPSKLAERYTELYDNQWTDACGIIEKHFDREQHILDALLEVLQDVMQFCKTNASKQMVDLQSVLGFSKTSETMAFPDVVHKRLKDCRKEISSTAIRNLFEMYLAHLKRSAPQKLRTAQEISPFVKECLEICWLMVIHEPPVVLAPVAQRGCELNTEIYKPYTCSGTHVEYTVWPALLLHEGGPVIAKGVAQVNNNKTH